MKRPVLIYLSLALLLFTLGGFLLERAAAARDESYRYLSNFSDALELVDKNYVDETTLDRLIDGAYRGLLEELDPESFLLDAQAALSFQKSPDEEISPGIGVDVSKRHGYAVVVSVVPGSPADGIMWPGDFIRTIDQQSTRESSLFEIRRMLAGNEGSEVHLKILRRDGFEPEAVKLTRGPITLRPFATESREDGVLHVILKRVDSDTVAATGRALQAAEKSRAVVLDLRGCSRGDLVEGARLADLFIDSGPLLRIYGRAAEPVVKRALAALSPSRRTVSAAEEAVEGESPDGRPDGYEYTAEASPRRTLWTGPLAVLTDSGTAGGAEIAAAALSDAGRAPLVGSQTFGRGSLQHLITLEDGAGLRLTIARALTPKAGEPLLGLGLKPDDPVEVDRTSSADAALERALERLSPDGEKKKAA